jgi:hypothetical protein
MDEAMKSDTKNQVKVAVWGGVALVMLLSAIFAAFEWSPYKGLARALADGSCRGAHGDHGSELAGMAVEQGLAGQHDPWQGTASVDETLRPQK